MTLDQINATAATASFAQKTRAAITKAALQIVGEDPAAMSAGKATKRHDLGVAVLNNPVTMIKRFLYPLAAYIGEVADPETLTDTDVENGVSAIWDDVAGVTYAENQ